MNRYGPTNNSNGAKKTRNNRRKKFMASVEDKQTSPSNTRESRKPRWI